MKYQGLPRPLLLWGLISVGVSIALTATTAIAILILYRTGTWTHDQVNIWGPILIFAAVVVPNVVSLIVLRRLSRTLLAPSAAQRDEPSPGPM